MNPAIKELIDLGPDLEELFVRMKALNKPEVTNKTGAFASIEIGPQTVETILRAITALSVGGGYVMVPREPTKKMLEAGGGVFWQHILPGGEPPTIDKNVWYDMLAASFEDVKVIETINLGTKYDEVLVTKKVCAEWKEPKT